MVYNLCLLKVWYEIFGHENKRIFMKRIRGLRIFSTYSKSYFTDLQSEGILNVQLH